MITQELIDTARTLAGGDKGLLTMGESNPTCNKPFARLGIPKSVVARPAPSDSSCSTGSQALVKDIPALDFSEAR